MKLLVFNPDHDYALGHGSPYYSAPASVDILARKLQFLPIVWGGANDAILTSDDKILKVSDCIDGRRESSISPEEISEVRPWGWNRKLKTRLEKIGIKDSVLPSDELIENLRRLSHRRISISANLLLHSPYVPEEFFTVDDALHYASSHQFCYFKLPWSSGGRGVVSTRELNAVQTEQWIRGAIRKQGSVMAEPGITRALDFASLWDTHNGSAIFEGLSVSLSDGRGKYKGNLSAPQSTIRNRIERFTTDLTDPVLHQQAEFINSHIAPLYKGKLGIDMMADEHGVLYPCVEINLRRTMGHVALDYCKISNDYSTLLPIQDIPLIILSEYETL